jgi:hypothetical protein
MKKALLTFAIVFTIAITGSALAQTPNISVYFDENLQEGSANCPPDPPMSVTDTLYVVGHYFNMWLASCEFAINFPSQIYYLSDIYDTDLHIGNAAMGVGLVWSPPKNAFDDVLLLRVSFAWNCNDCVGVPGDGYPIEVIPTPAPQNQLRAVRWPDSFEINPVGMVSLVCPQVPVEDSSWGQIKALYN